MAFMAEDQGQSIGPNHPNNDPSLERNVCICGLLLVAIFLALYLLSPPFEYDSELPNPTLVVTGLFVVASLIAFFGLNSALKISRQRQKSLLPMVIVFAISTRLIAAFTCPILEIDYYRYLWDGKVTASGISPYLYSPDQVLNSNPNDAGALGKLNGLSLASESNHRVLSRIHFENYTTIYPPISQCVFALVMKWFPDSASVEAHVIAMKLALVLFDIGTMLLAWLLLKQLGFRIGWMMVYAWNPLVIKEIANSGHLDSIATFFMMAAIVLIVRWRLSGSSKVGIWLLAGSGIALGLGVGAKLFPVVVVPALTVYVMRQSVAKVSLFLILFAITTLFVLWPMIEPIVEQSGQSEVQSLLVATESQHGMVGFFSQWRMNDTIFSFVYLNLKDSNREIDRTPWFVFTGSEFRDRFDQWFREKGIGDNNPAYFFTRVLTLGMLLIFYLWQLLILYRINFEKENVAGQQESIFLLQRLVLVLTAFLFLQPTVNPWYFVWVFPLACFSMNRGWRLASGLLLTYYARFWLQSLDGTFEFVGRQYSGEGVYDHIVVWIVLVLIAGSLLLFRKSSR